MTVSQSRRNCAANAATSLLICLLFAALVTQPCDAFLSVQDHCRVQHAYYYPTTSILAVSAEAPSNNKKTKNNSNKRKEKPPRFTQSVHETKPPAAAAAPAADDFQKDRMWNTRKKSLEELETILAKRWGTDISKFTADDSFYDDDDDEEEDVTEEPTTSAFRARRVLDPWKTNDKVEEEKKLSTFFGDNKDAALLQKARKNQERIQQRRGREFLDPKEEDDDDDNDSATGGGSLDFMIRPRPAGGVGTKQQQPPPQQRALGSTTKTPTPAPVEEKKPDSPGFFFRSAPVDDDDGEDDMSSSSTRTAKASTADVVDESKPKKPANIPSKPLVDENGKPLFLTIAQAERNFQQSLKDNSVEPLAEDGDDESDDEDDNNRFVSYGSWQDLGITHSRLLENLNKMNCRTPLSVQAKSCPQILFTGDDEKDVVIGTYTGSGKTLAFLVPLVQRLLDQQASAADNSKSGSMKVLVVAPGRELASQIVAVARDLVEGLDVTVQMAIGGTTFARNLETLRKRKPDIVVGTPGRIAELVVGRPGERGAGRLKTSQLQTIVLDEFDALLEYKPHREPTLAILETLKRQKQQQLQSILCSATAADVMDSPKVQETILRSDRYAVALADDNDSTVTSSSPSPEGTAPPPRVSKTVIHGVVHVPQKRLALDTLRRILHTEPFPQQILIFVENSRKVDMIVERLDQMGILAAPLHGGTKSEKMDRAEVNKALREGYVGIVVATELAARGLDAPLLTHVINMDLPTDASHYAHRAGRCGRGGRPGVVINLTTDPRERKVPQKFADQLGVDMYSVEVRDGKLNLVTDAETDADTPFPSRTES